MKRTLILVVGLFVSNLTFAQKINYSSNKNYQKVRMVVKYPTLTKKTETIEAEKVVFVQSPMVSNKKQIYGALISPSK